MDSGYKWWPDPPGAMPYSVPPDFPGKVNDALPAHGVRRVGPETMHGYDSHDRWRKRCGNLRLADIGDVMDPLHVEMVNLGMKSCAHLRRSSRQINQRVARVDGALLAWLHPCFE